jgi:hypothetical protein
MIRTEHFILAVVVGLSAVLAGIAAVQNDVAAMPAHPTLSESPRRVAEQFLRTEDTFAFDGVDSSLALMAVSRAGEQQTFSFRFESLHGGYGDRAGRTLPQAITPHQAIITVEGGRVVSAIMDGRWDMLAQAPA